jgi:hypothetical protein
MWITIAFHSLYYILVPVWTSRHLDSLNQAAIARNINTRHSITALQAPNLGSPSRIATMANPGQPSYNGTDTEPFPSFDNASPNPDHTNINADSSSVVENRPTASSSLSGRLRRVSQSFEVSGPPEGFMAATGTIAASIFSRQTVARRPSDTSIPMQTSQSLGDTSRQSTFPAVNEEPPEEKADASVASPRRNLTGEPAAAAPFDNGYHFPPKHSFGQSTKLGLIAFWNYVRTPTGFLVTVYGLNVVAWGGMLFLLLW